MSEAGTTRQTSAHGELIDILIKEGLLTEKQAVHASRLRSKLTRSKPLLEIVKELGYVTDEQVTAAIRKNKLSMRIGSLLVELGLISEADLESAFQIQRASQTPQKLGEVLVKNNFIKEFKLLEALSLQLGYPFIDPRFTNLDLSLLHQVPSTYRAKGAYIPIGRVENRIVVAFANVLDQEELDEARTMFPEGISPAIATREAIVEAYQRFERGAQSRETSEEDSAAGIVERIILDAIDFNVSDIHMEPLPDRLRVRFRRDGVLEPYKEFPRDIIPNISSRLKIMCKADIAEKRRHQGGRILFEYPGGELDMRASFYVTIHGEAIVLRLLNRQGNLIDITGIGMYPKILKRFIESALSRPSGVVIVTGPTGSGKTTTVYSCIHHLNTPLLSIITAEEPVEYVIPGISQCSIDPKINLTFEETLRHIVRQDPDVILIGEIRDNYSAEVAVQAALTGHKVLTTFHTEDSIGGLIRLMNMDIEAFLISSTVVSVVAQRLLRRVCPECSKPYKPTPGELQMFGYTQAMVQGANFRKGAGCSHCRYTGYRGRVAVFELLILDEMVRNAILERRTSFDIRKIALESAGLVTLFEEGLVKASEGITSLEEVMRCLPLVLKPRSLEETRRLLGV
ncbi:GspE/PulE family protein [Desulfomicrobium escambiense]|uniref:GspE/PulE family protein n=1 Tax=Desulfomicrobium escambiense TaxID=29503 RepID=UPI000400330F|nr:GspE/PulE family protein [Desulfomicrobium escambiense]